MSSTNPTLSPSLHVAIPAVSTFALLSLLSTASLLGFISYRMFTWRRYYNTPIFRNQYVILIFNLCMADLLQALALTISWHWLQMGEIRSNSNWCFGQGLLIQIGDVSSAFFVLAIALHTWFRVVKSKDMRYNIFIGAVAFIWLAAILLTIIAPIMNGRQVYAPLGYWAGIPSSLIDCNTDVVKVLYQRQIRIRSPRLALYMDLHRRIQLFSNLYMDLLPPTQLPAQKWPPRLWSNAREGEETRVGIARYACVSRSLYAAHYPACKYSHGCLRRSYNPCGVSTRRWLFHG